MPKTLFVQEWQATYSKRHDGFTVHLSKEQSEEYKELDAPLFGDSSPKGDLIEMEVDDQIYDGIVKSMEGKRSIYLFEDERGHGNKDGK